MKILITGYKGFIGQNLTKSLENHTLTFYEWSDALPDVKGLDWVIHLGAISSTTESDVEKVMEQNLDFSKWLLNCCTINKVNFQYSSSASVYGKRTEFKETSKVNPLSPYAWSKYLFDKHVLEKIETTRITDYVKIQGFRYFNVYGPHEDHKGDQASPYHKFELQAKNTGRIKIFENSDQYLRDFVHVDTVVDVHKTFFEVEESGIWNIGTGKPKSFLKVAQEVAEKYNATIEYIPMPDHIKNQYQTYTCANLDKLTKHYYRK